MQQTYIALDTLESNCKQTRKSADMRYAWFKLADKYRITECGVAKKEWFAIARVIREEHSLIAKRDGSIFSRYRGKVNRIENEPTIDPTASAGAISPTTGRMHEKEFILELSFLRAITPPGLSFTIAKLLRARRTFEAVYYLQWVSRKRATLKKIREETLRDFRFILPYNQINNRINK